MIGLLAMFGGLTWAELTGAAILFLWLFWGAYVLVMGIYRAHLANRLTWVTYCLGGLYVVIGIVMDVAANLLIASIVFWERPHEWLVTTRLIRLKKSNEWRGKLARWVCANLLDVFDPVGTHCG